MSIYYQVTNPHQGSHHFKYNKLMGGNGCKHHPDCFICPEPDCVFVLDKNNINAKYLRVSPLEPPLLEKNRKE